MAPTETFKLYGRIGAESAHLAKLPEFLSVSKLHTKFLPFEIKSLLKSNCEIRGDNTGKKKYRH
jgi:hypothetical protein